MNSGLTKACLFAIALLPAAAMSAPSSCSLLGNSPDERAAKQWQQKSSSPVVVINGQAWDCECGRRRLGGDVQDDQRRLGGDAEQRKLGGDAQDDRRRLGGDTQDDRRRLGGDAEERRLGGDAQDDRRRLGGDTEDRRLGGDAQDDRRRLGGDTESRRLDGDASTLTCSIVAECRGFQVNGTSAAIRYFDGTRLRDATNACVP